jgi:hypothetical protein
MSIATHQSHREHIKKREKKEKKSHFSSSLTLSMFFDKAGELLLIALTYQKKEEWNGMRITQWMNECDTYTRRKVRERERERERNIEKEKNCFEMRYDEVDIEWNCAIHTTAHTASLNKILSLD